MNLTDNDLSRIRGVLTNYCDVPEIIEQDRAIYIAGMRAGIERAAKLCEGLHFVGNEMIAGDVDNLACADAIRALLTETAGESPSPPQP